MNDIYQDLYYEASLQCINEGKAEGWTWEKHYAELIIKECIKQCSDADSRVYISEYFGMED